MITITQHRRDVSIFHRLRQLVAVALCAQITMKCMCYRSPDNSQLITSFVDEIAMANDLEAEHEIVFAVGIVRFVDLHKNASSIPLIGSQSGDLEDSSSTGRSHTTLLPRSCSGPSCASVQAAAPTEVQEG